MTTTVININSKRKKKKVININGKKNKMTTTVININSKKKKKKVINQWEEKQTRI
jgi:hypothetical protein